MLRISSPNYTQSRGAPSIWERGIGKSAHPSMLCIPEAFMRPYLITPILSWAYYRKVLHALACNKVFKCHVAIVYCLTPKHSSLQALVLKFSIV